MGKATKYNVDMLRNLTQDTIDFVQAFNAKAVEYRLPVVAISHTGGFNAKAFDNEDAAKEAGELYRRIAEIADSEIRRQRDAEVMTARAGGNSRKGTLSLTSRVVTSGFCPVVYQLRLAAKRAAAIKKASDEAAARAVQAAGTQLNIEATTEAMNLGFMDAVSLPVAAVRAAA